MTATPDLSVVFPVYNEEENIPLLLREIKSAVDGKWTYEIVAVDDGSTDRSLAVLRESRAEHPTLRVLALEKNSGQTAALDAAWRAARGTYVVKVAELLAGLWGLPLEEVASKTTANFERVFSVKLPR